METIDWRELARHRLDMARKKFASACLLLDQGHFADAASRAYYAMLHGARALLATKGLDSRKHSGIISLFNLHFIKTGVVTKELGTYLLSSKDMREESDYNEFYIVNKTDIFLVIQQARAFLDAIEKAINCMGEKK